MACGPLSRPSLNKTFRTAESEFKDHIGFVLYDPVKKREVYSFHGAQYMTPASNTKILTFYTTLLVLGDSIPGLKYIIRNDSLIFWGTGDPSFLYPAVYQDSVTWSFLDGAKENLFFSACNFRMDPYGPGWAWDDFQYAYSAERSPLPIYGNTLKRNATPVNNDWKYALPYVPQPETDTGAPSPEEAHYKVPTLLPADTTMTDVPFRTDPSTVATMLSDTLHRPVHTIGCVPSTGAHVLYSVPTDSLIRVMLQESDNFIAEHLLMMCAGVLYDTLDTTLAIDYMMENHLVDLPDLPHWVDGSGLSRYNQITPRSIVAVWDRIHQLMPDERLFPLLATGGKVGTIKSWYKADEPYIFGKTGTLAHNHCLSGFLNTESGETLIFSLMNENYLVPGDQIKMFMERVLREIHERY